MLIGTFFTGRGLEGHGRSLQSLNAFVGRCGFGRNDSWCAHGGRCGFSTKAGGGRFDLGNLKEVSEREKSLVFRSTSNNPYYNLAIEDYLLRESSHTSNILFFYTNRPCMVLGRNQNPWLECDLNKIQDGLPSVAIDGERVLIDLVRRRSGGGTVFHDEGNLNYSVIVPNDAAFRRAKHANMMVKALNGMQVEFKAEIKVNERNDIVIKRDGEEEWLKISGSAFKLIKGRALHHGTLLISSPYLSWISGLLRSPGREMIKAKGVESVRSKVGNLFWTEDKKIGKEMAELISHAATQEFQSMYGEGMEMVEVGEAEIKRDKIAAGVEEMMTNEWRFEQTPRFDFGVEQPGEAEGKSGLAFHANRGVIESLTVGSGVEPQYVTDETRIHVHQVQDWQQTLARVLHAEENSSILRDGEIMQQLATIFPYWKP